MNLRLLIRPVLALLLAPLVMLLTPCASGQQICGGSSESVQPAQASANAVVPVATAGCNQTSAKTDDPWGVGPQLVTQILTRAEALRRIGVYEAALRGPEAARASDATVAKVYARLASLYDDAAMYERSEAALKHAIALLRSNAGRSRELSDDINGLGLLHAEMGKLHQAEKEELEALRLRESLGDSLGMAQSWNALSGVYFREGRYATSRDFAQRALDEFSVDREADIIDRISSRLNLSVALCYMKACPSAVPLLQDAVAIAKTAFKPNDYPVGEGEFLLGFAYWKSGDMARASDYMQEGSAIMKEQLGWGHPTYLNALGQYARFLRDDRRGEDAEVVERQIRRAEAVVDVRSMPTRNGADGVAGLR